MFVKPVPQPFLRRRRQLQDKTGKTQGLENFKVAPCIGNDMRPAATQLFKRQRLARLVGKTGTGGSVSHSAPFSAFLKPF
jgi:hypothetical protein